MIMKQETLRARLKNIIKVEGINQKHIANQININESLLSRFKNGRTDLLYRCDIEALDNYLTSKGY